MAATTMLMTVPFRPSSVLVAGAAGCGMGARGAGLVGRCLGRDLAEKVQE